MRASVPATARRVSFSASARGVLRPKPALRLLVSLLESCDSRCIPDFLLEYAQQWAYPALFLLTFLESAAFFGFVFPGETMVVLAGILAARGAVTLWLVFLLGSAGAVLGDTVGYWIGRRFGKRFFLRFGRYLFLNEQHFEDARAFFEKHGGKTVFLGRFVAWLRALTPAVAGTARMPYRRFLCFNFAGGVCWVVGFSCLGFFLGGSWHLLKKWFGRAGIGIGLCVGVLLLAWIWTRARSERIQALRRALTEKLSREMPGLWPFVKERFRTGSWYGLRLTVTLFVLFGCSVAFFEVFRVPPQRFHALDDLLRRLGFLRPLAWGTRPVAVLALSLLTGAWLWSAGRVRETVAFLGALVAGAVLVSSLASFLRRAQPGRYPDPGTFLSGVSMGWLAWTARWQLRRSSLRAAAPWLGLALFLFVSCSRVPRAGLLSVATAGALAVAWVGATTLLARALREESPAPHEGKA